MSKFDGVILESTIMKSQPHDHLLEQLVGLNSNPDHGHFVSSTMGRVCESCQVYHLRGPVYLRSGLIRMQEILQVVE